MRHGVHKTDAGDTEYQVRAEHQDPRQHLGLIYRNAENLGRVFECEPCEFFGAAYLAMVDAVRTWNHTKGCRFSTHAMEALKFRTYKTVMKEKGKKHREKTTNGVRTRAWVDPLGTKSLSSVGEIGVRDSGVDHAAETQRKMEEVLQIAAEVSPLHGVEAIWMMARGVGDRQIGIATGRGLRYAKWLRMEIKDRLDGGAA